MAENFKERDRGVGVPEHLLGGPKTHLQINKHLFQSKRLFLILNPKEECFSEEGELAEGRAQG